MKSLLYAFFMILAAGSLTACGQTAEG